MHVYLGDDAIEVDLVDGYEIQRTRVFFADVTLITMHRCRSRANLWIMGSLILVILAFFLAVSQTIPEMKSADDVVMIVAAVVCSPFAVMFLMMLHPSLYVTVFGKRTKASMRFSFRQAHGRRVCLRLCDLVTRHQQAERDRRAALPAAAVTAQPFAAPPADGPA
ncbi:MAG: hypothetical protein H0W83_10245, partial [Planctomycetes bacterium]|nr:hypothetical protein [Planctomycetota bacterium]